MSNHLRRLVVLGLEHLCAVVDWFPWHDGRWYLHGQRGCVLGLSNKAAVLDAKWGTGVWGKTSEVCSTSGNKTRLWRTS